MQGPMFAGMVHALVAGYNPTVFLHKIDPATGVSGLQGDTSSGKIRKLVDLLRSG